MPDSSSASGPARSGLAGGRVLPKSELRLMFENSLDGILLGDSGGAIHAANLAACRLLSRPKEEIVAAGMSGIAGKTDSSLAAALGECNRMGSFRGIVSFQRSDGSDILADASLVGFENRKGRVSVTTIFREITAQHSAEDVLRKSEAMLARAEQVASLGSFEWDIASGELHWSDQIYRMFGVRPEEFKPTYATFLELVHPDDRPRVRSAVARSLEQREPYRIEFRVVLPDSSIRHHLAQSELDFDATGRPVRIVGTALDITERKSLEEQLRRRAEELQKLMDVAPVVLHVAHDPECLRITGNPAGNKLFNADEGSNLSASVPSASVGIRFFRDGVELRPEDLPLQVTAATGQDVRDCEIEIILPDGKRSVVWGNATPLRDAAGQVRGAVAAFQDITANKARAEAALHESEERFRNTADSAPIIMWLGDPQKRVTFFNKEISVFSGLPVEQLLGDGWTQVIHPEDLEAARAIYYESVDRRSACQVEYRARRADGEYRNMLGTSTPRYIGGVYAGQVGTVSDITDLKRRQEKDLARQKLESLGMLAGGIAHDFNNLLGGVLSQVELALSEMVDGSSPESQIKNIRAVALRGTEIVRQLMVCAGQEPDSLELVDVSRLIDETLELLQVLISKHAVLERHQGADVPAVRCNPARLRQLLMNLIINASEAIGESNGVIRISTERLTVIKGSPAATAGLTEGEYLQLGVSDTGSGISPEDSTKIFDPFFTTKSKGRGLGLAVVQGIVRDLGGVIRVSSVLGQGTTVRVWLPGSGSLPVPGRGTANAEAASQPQRSILLVEDEETLRLALSAMLEKSGFSVLEASDGFAALQILRGHPGQLEAMLLDVTLPGMSSPALLREAKRLKPDLRVILTSAYSEQTVSEMFAGMPIETFIRKPYRLDEVMELIRGH